MRCCKIYGLIIFIVLTSCSGKRERPAEVGSKKELKVEVFFNGKFIGRLDQNTLRGLKEVKWKTGLGDTQRGVCLYDALKKLGVEKGKIIKVFSLGNEVKKFNWIDVKQCSIVVGLTHRKTLKLMGRKGALKRKNWLKHLYRIEVEGK